MATMRPGLKQTRRHSWFGKPLEHDDEIGVGTIGARCSTHEGSPIRQCQSVETANPPLWNSKHIQTPKKGKNLGTELIKQASSASNSVNQFTKENTKEENNNQPIGKECIVPCKLKKQDWTIEESKETDSSLTQPAQNSKEGSQIDTVLDCRSLVFDFSSQKSTFDDKATKEGGITEKQLSFNSQVSRLTHRRATVDYSSSGKPSVTKFNAMDYNRRTAYSSLGKGEKLALERIKDVCRDYILYRLKRKNLIQRVTLKRKQSNERWLIKEILFIEKELERLYEYHFSGISKQIGITLRSEDVLRKVFFELSAEIITTENKSKRTEWGKKSKRKPFRPSLSAHSSVQVEITWGRIFALLAVAGGLAVECVQQGHADLVDYLIEYIGEFSRLEGIPPWITSQGGWEVLRRFTFEGSKRSTANPCYFITITNVAVAFVVCTLGAAIGAMAIGSLAFLILTRFFELLVSDASDFLSWPFWVVWVATTKLVIALVVSYTFFFSNYSFHSSALSK